MGMIFISVIDFSQLEQWIVTFEQMFEDENINLVEQEFVIKQVLARINQKAQKIKMADAVQNVPLGSLIKRVLKKGETDEN